MIAILITLSVVLGLLLLVSVSRLREARAACLQWQRHTLEAVRQIESRDAMLDRLTDADARAA
jgi:hypothetical protein